MKHFDLNIDKILENWELPHAIRELIANALDEATLTSSAAPEIVKDNAGWWRIRDFGRGLRYQDLIQSENPEKLGNPHVIGKFGIGLKDALATFERKRIQVLIRSRHGDISLSRVSKHSFEDIVTLHASVAPATSPDMQGTECNLHGVSDADIESAKRLFLCFTPAQPIERTNYGAVYERMPNAGCIYINGMKVAEEPNFLFSYNITLLNAAIKRALNRERQNLGRSAYSDRVRAILLACKTESVAQVLANDLQSHSHGDAHDELSWLDVQEHAVRILNSLKKVLFVSATDLVSRPDLIDGARSTGFQVVAVPENLALKIQGITDITGNPVTELHEFVKQRNEGFHFEWVAPDDLTPSERAVWDHCSVILGLIGGRPEVVKDIRISETMCSSLYQILRETVGLWDGNEGWIIIKRSQLRTLSDFAGTLLHEALHAKYDLLDVSKDLESYLTKLAGDLAARVIAQN
ncbi:MAG: ATP-binding protein [Planctomycetota bacterium]|nr:ATP-binding protein [Planctomycetota bacterium]